MEKRLTREEFLERVFRQQKGHLNADELRMVRLRIPGREVMLAHVIGVTDEAVYRNLGLHIGIHEGENHSGDSIGLLQFTPWESTVVAADIAVKSGSVEIAFMDRFNGSLILTGNREDILEALKGVIDFFRDVLHVHVCEITES